MSISTTGRCWSRSCDLCTKCNTKWKWTTTVTFPSREGHKFQCWYFLRITWFSVCHSCVPTWQEAGRTLKPKEDYSGAADLFTSECKNIKTTGSQGQCINYEAWTSNRHELQTQNMNTEQHQTNSTEHHRVRPMTETHVYMITLHSAPPSRHRRKRKQTDLTVLFFNLFSIFISN